MRDNLPNGGMIRLIFLPIFRSGRQFNAMRWTKIQKRGISTQWGGMRLGFLIFWLLCSGCERPSFINKFGFHTNLREQAEQAEAHGNYQQALDVYEKCLNGTSQDPEAHYRMALIYDSKLQDPIGALYHFQRFVEKKSNDSRLKEVAKNMKRLRLLLASQLSEGVVVSRADAIRLRNENLQLQAQLALLRSQKTPRTIQGKIAKGFSSNPITRVAEQLVGAETRTYTVESGDTLAMISKKFYKTPNRWRDIADANQNQLNGSTHLKVGMTLIIP